MFAQNERISPTEKLLSCVYLEIPNEKNPTEVLLYEFGLFHLARLRMKKETKALAQKFESVQKNLEERFLERQETWKQIPFAKAVLQDSWVDLIHSLRRFHRFILNEAEGNKKHVLLKKYFPDNLNPLIRNYRFPIFTKKVKYLFLLWINKGKFL